jgi:hypothetical protein
MKYQTLDEVRQKASLAREPGAAVLSRQNRLERWASLLEAHQGKVLPFFGIEHLPRRELAAMRADQTPLAVAFADPALRADGLKGDDVGSVMEYFELSRGQIHRLFCDCHYRGTMTSASVAAELRSIAAGGPFRALVSWVLGRSS